MIVRIWHGYTTPENADAYKKLLYEEVWPGIGDKKIKGYKSIELLTRILENDEVEFITIMKFESLEDVMEFAGPNYNEAYVPKKAQLLLKRFDSFSQHYELLSTFNY